MSQSSANAAAVLQGQLVSPKGTQGEKETATHSSVLAWRIPGTEEPGGLPSMGLQSRTRLKQLSSSSSQGRSGRRGYSSSHQTAATPYSELKGAQDVEKRRVLAPQLRYV